MCKLQARLLSADTYCAVQVWRWGQQYRASVIQASRVVFGAACQNSHGHPLGQYIIASLLCPVHAHRCTPSSQALLPPLPAQGAPMPEMLQLHAWLEAHIPATDPDASVTRISHGDYRRASMRG